MTEERYLGEGFERVVEIDRTIRPEPEEVLKNSHSFHIVRLATDIEKRGLTEFTKFLQDPIRGKRLDSDILRAQAAQYHPVVQYLSWLLDQPGIPSTRRTEIIGMELDKTWEITQAEGEPVNLMGHEVNISYNASERNMISGLLSLIDEARQRANQMRIWIRRN